MGQTQPQEPWKAGLLLKPRWGRRKRGTVPGAIMITLLVIGIVSVLTGCNQAQTTSTAKRTQPASTSSLAQPAFLAEHLTFHGVMSGTLTTGVDPHPISHDDPIRGLEYPVGPNGNYSYPVPTWTQCSDFGSASFAGRHYIAVIVGNVGSTRIAIIIEINKGNPAYTQPETPLETLASDQATVEVYEAGGQNRRWEPVRGPAGQGQVLVLHADRASGTVDAWLATTDEASDATSTLHIQGDWRCG